MGGNVEEQHGSLVLLCSHKVDGNMSKKFGEDADQNRQNFIKKMGFDVNRFLLMQADNGDHVVELKEEVTAVPNLYYKLVEADAIICKYPNVYLYLNFGDCIPFTIYDKKKNVFAFAHLGWRSTYLDLHKKLFFIFVEQYHSRVEDLMVYIGPSIKKESYLLPSPKQREEEAWGKYVEYVKDEMYSIDLNRYVIDFFIGQGLKESQIVMDQVDTGKDELYFSHYRSTYFHEKEGRFLYAVGMKKEE